MKHFRFVLFLLVLPLILSACYWNDDVETSQVGVKVDGGRIVECLGPGIYTDLGLFTDLREVSASTLTFQVTDPEVATADNQLVGISITIQARRQSSCEAVTNLLTNWAALVDDPNLIATVSATAKEGIKIGTRDFTLTQLMSDRNGLAQKIMAALEQDTAEYSTEVINVTVENVALSPEYSAQMQEKALLTAQIETEARRQDLIKQQASNEKLQREQDTEILQAQLKKEEAQTQVQVEIAEREGEVIAARNKIYSLNPEAFELERLRLMQDVLGDKAVFYFLEPGTDLSLLLNSAGQQFVPLGPPAQ